MSATLEDLLAVAKSLGIDSNLLGVAREPGSDRAQSSTPFTPADARQHKQVILPKEVIDSVNELIERIMSKLSITRSEIIKLGFLEIEPVYEDAGWKVQYHSPSHDESYEPYYVFQKQS
jgi:hypothetical protein